LVIIPARKIFKILQLCPTRRRNRTDQQIANCLVTRFTRQLKGWWNNYLNEIKRNWILHDQKRNDHNQLIVDEMGNIVQDVVNTLITTLNIL
jgi:hypothetical protein